MSRIRFDLAWGFAFATGSVFIDRASCKPAAVPPAFLARIAAWPHTA